ncbi:hypothetical protein IV203_032848 [Nitzschia inconspicua]|uniref:Uncharacterized protein n=1 Tax=Nitzschia inconspicua TaxID=303405 RepID=A0A9K3KKC7_9STRA|nr:hypothetical protein IV203_032848 [Nitzschia inconspicua]
MITGRTSVDSGSLLYFSAPVEQQDQQSQTNEEWKDPDAPAGIDGAEFFGGNKQKEEFFDPIAEQQAAEEVQASQQAMTYGRFFASSDQPSAAFENVWTARLGQSLQQKLNSIIYTPAHQSTRTSVLQIEWAANLKWETPFVSSKENASPVLELQAAKEFYRQIDIAVVGGRQLSDSTVEFSWELAVVWPTFWAPRVHLSGTSTLTLKEALGPSTSNAAITQQVDCVFSSSNNNLLPLLASQIKPRFWDWYHIGMSPTTELLPRETVKNGSYKVYRLPPRLVLSPTMVETGTRNTRNAQVIPNHAFTCIIKTMGPQKQDYVPASPVQVQIGRRKIQSEDSVMEDVQLELSWGIPLSVQFQAMNEELPLPGDNPEDDARSSPRCCYSLQPRRQVATIAYGGNVQDPEVTDVRKHLYQQVLKDGWKPKLDENGRPMFFFWQNDVKACYTDEGLGMAIYEWRPALAKSNEVGIELQID